MTKRIRYNSGRKNTNNIVVMLSYVVVCVGTICMEMLGPAASDMADQVSRVHYSRWLEYTIYNPVIKAINLSIVYALTGFFFSFSSIFFYIILNFTDSFCYFIFISNIIEAANVIFWWIFTAFSWAAGFTFSFNDSKIRYILNRKKGKTFLEMFFIYLFFSSLSKKSQLHLEDFFTPKKWPTHNSILLLGILMEKNYMYWDLILKNVRIRFMHFQLTVVKND